MGVLLMMAVLSGAAPHAPVPADAKAAAAEARADKAKARVLSGYWKAVLVEDAKGKTDDPGKLFGYVFREDEYAVWCRRGDLSLSPPFRGEMWVRVRAADPMHLDIYSNAAGKEVVLPCIFRFDGDKLVIVEPGGRPFVRARADGAYPERPTGFEVTAKNGYVRRTLVTCNQLDQD